MKNQISLIKQHLFISGEYPTTKELKPNRARETKWYLSTIIQIVINKSDYTYRKEIKNDISNRQRLPSNEHWLHTPRSQLKEEPSITLPQCSYGEKNCNLDWGRTRIPASDYNSIIKYFPPQSKFAIEANLVTCSLVYQF